MAWGTPSAIGTAAAGNNADVTPGLPSYSVGDGLLICASSRGNSGAGPGTLTASGYTELATYAVTGNHRVSLLAKKAGASESDPTVVVSGGASGGTVLAFMFSLSGGDWDNLGSIAVTTATEADGFAGSVIETSAITPGESNTAVIAVGAWANDYTSFGGITAPSWGTLIGATDSALGADASLAAAYVIQSSAAAISADSFGLAGGSSLDLSLCVALRMAGAVATPKGRNLLMGVG